jgi:hypothetical protein
MQDYTTRRRNVTVAKFAAAKAARDWNPSGMSDNALLTEVQNALFTARRSAESMGHIERSVMLAKAEEALFSVRTRGIQQTIF